MSQGKGVISLKYPYDWANAIRVKLGVETLFTPEEMAAAIANIDGTLSGTITPSTNTEKGEISLALVDGIADAIRAKLDVETQYTPAQIADAILSITSAAPTIVSWASGTDAEVGAMIDAAHAGLIDLQQDGGWAVGDVRTITVGAFTGGGNVSHAEQQIDIVITSFDEYMSCGNVLQFDFKSELVDRNRMNSTDTNVGGYGASEMKMTTLPALVNALPDWLKSRLIEFSVLTSAGNTSSTIETVTGNKLALRSEMEVFGQTSKDEGYNEGQQLNYYTVSLNRYKYRNNVIDNSWHYWFRTPAKYFNYQYCNFSGYSGGHDRTSATSLHAVAPFGCL